MALAERRPQLRAMSEERRRFQRVQVNLLGRYMLADRREFPCQVVNMSPGGMALIAPVAGQPGEHIIAYVDHLGRLDRLILANGLNVTCRIIDVSQSGAGLTTDQRPPIGSLVTSARSRAAWCATWKMALPSS